MFSEEGGHLTLYTSKIVPNTFFLKNIFKQILLTVKIYIKTLGVILFD